MGRGVPRVYTPDQLEAIEAQAKLSCQLENPEDADVLTRWHNTVGDIETRMRQIDALRGIHWGDAGLSRMLKWEASL